MSTLHTVLRSASKEVVIGHDQRFCLIGERINPTGRKLLAAELEAGDFSTVERDALEQLVRAQMGGAAELAEADVHFIAVGTPPGEDGSADLKYVLAAARNIARHMTARKLIVDKSTVPVGTADKVREVVAQELAARGVDIPFSVASNPEFLKEGAAINDFMSPDRVVVGADDEYTIGVMRRIYEPFQRTHDRLMVMDVRSAELTKYAANAMLATRISFMNEMANLAEALGADIEQVRRGIGADPRIGYHFLYPGAGYGGSCFPKDVRALIRSAEQQGFDSQILRAVEARNARQKELLFETLGELFQGRWQGRTVALWGLAFKPGTDDLREAPSLVLLEALLRHGVRVRAHDPVANAGVAARYPDALACAQLTLHDSPYAAVEGADALVLVTEWKQFRQPDFQKIRGSMRTPLLVDGRNLYAPARMAELGFIYQGIGRPRAGHCKASAA